jgi:hypothetical protein
MPLQVRRRRRKTQQRDRLNNKKAGVTLNVATTQYQENRRGQQHSRRIKDPHQRGHLKQTRRRPTTTTPGVIDTTPKKNNQTTA